LDTLSVIRTCLDPLAEPLSKVSFFEAFRAIEDETVVRLEAQEAISQFAGSAYLEERMIEYVRSESFTSFDAFVDRVTAAEKSRLDIVREKRSEILGAFENNATSLSEIRLTSLSNLPRHIFLENRRAIYDRNRTHRARCALCGTAALHQNRTFRHRRF